MSESEEEIRRKRLKIRSWRRGTREMDLILGPFADQVLPGLSEAELAQYEALLRESDHDLYQWISGQRPVPEGFAGLIGRIRANLDASHG